MLSEQAIKKFAAIYQSEFGVQLSFEEATDKATALIRLFKLILDDSKGESDAR